MLFKEYIIRTKKKKKKKKEMDRLENPRTQGFVTNPDTCVPLYFPSVTQMTGGPVSGTGSIIA